MKYLLSGLLLCLIASSAQSVPLYLQQFNIEKIDNAELEKAHKQIKEHKDVKRKEALFVSPFHQQGQQDETDKESFCNSCHQQAAHRLNKRKRSFLNMHSRYISCESCHFRPKNSQLEYRWFNFNEPDNKKEAKRITPFYNNEAVFILSDHQLSQQIKNTWKEKTSIDKAKLKLRIHRPLSKKGPDCVACHSSKNPMLDLKALEFSDKTIKELQQHVIPRFFSRFKKEEERLRMTDLLQ